MPVMLWIGLMILISVLFWITWWIADKADRAEAQEQWEASLREEEARRYEAFGYMKEAQWIREGRRW